MIWLFYVTLLLSSLSLKKKALGDSAYIGEPNVIVPYKKPPRRPLRQNEKLFNKQVSHVRISVENVFKRIKDFKIINQIYRGDYHNSQISIVSLK